MAIIKGSMKSVNNIADSITEMDDQSSNLQKFDLNSTMNRFTFVLLGAGMLMPWNAILASMDFFTAQFPSYQPSFSLLVAVSAPMFLV